MSNKVGRPTKYKPEYTRQVGKLCLLGATDEDLARFFEVDSATINRWKTKHPEFYDTIKEHRDIADSDIAKSLYQRAKGYTCKETKVFMHEGNPVEVEIEKHYPPETAACVYWLKNRQPKNWRDKREVTVDTVNIVSDGFDEALAMRRKDVKNDTDSSGED